MDYIIFVVVILFLFFMYYLLNKTVKLILREKQQRKNQEYYQQQKENQEYYQQQITSIIKSGSSHVYVKYLIQETQKLSPFYVDAYLAERIAVAVCLINKSTFEVEQDRLKEQFCTLIANNVNIIKKVFTEDLDQLEELLDSYVEDFYSDSLDDKYGHLDTFDVHLDKKMSVWNKKGLTEKINLYNKSMAGETEYLEDILSELQTNIQLSDYSKYIDGLSVRFVTILV